MKSDVGAFVRSLGHEPRDPRLFEQAFTHPSFGRANYQRLEFLGDRVLGLVMAEWLSERFPAEQEGLLSHRFTTLVSRATCAVVGNALGVPEHIRLGKQALEDGAARSENVVGDVVEALIGAIYVEAGLEPARQLIRRGWTDLVEGQSAAPRHPKSLLHEWAEGHGRKPPTYEIVARSGPPHAPRFTVRASVRGLGHADGEGPSKQDAETAAATELLKLVQ